MITSNSKVILATFILEMYAKCGSLTIARSEIFLLGNVTMVNID